VRQEGEVLVRLSLELGVALTAVLRDRIGDRAEQVVGS
jgi:hypothetical protein